MSANQPVVRERRPSALHRYRGRIWGGAPPAGIAIALLVALSFTSSKATTAPDVTTTWPAGERPAPAFALSDQGGKPVTLASLHGRPAIVTFIDPLCRDFCPREASVLSE